MVRLRWVKPRLRIEECEAGRGGLGSNVVVDRRVTGRRRAGDNYNPASRHGGECVGEALLEAVDHFGRGEEVREDAQAAGVQPEEVPLALLNPPARPSF